MCSINVVVIVIVVGSEQVTNSEPQGSDQVINSEPQGSEQVTNQTKTEPNAKRVGLVGWLWTKHHILLGPRCYLPVELSPCSKGGQGEGEAAVTAHQPASRESNPGPLNQ